MGHKKRNPSQSPISPKAVPAAGETAVLTIDSTAEIKSECERSLNALRRGNHTRSLRLMREALAKHNDSALLHRVHGSVHAKIADMFDDTVVKQRHLKAAIDSAKKAVEISPNSIEYANFHATLLFESALDSTGYEMAVVECERALTVENPVDPALELLYISEETMLATPEARINQAKSELSSLVQKCNIASISSWMKALGGEDNKYRFIPVRNFNDPTELGLILGPTPPPPRGNNEMKKSSKTPEERRKEIEAHVAVARLLQQQQRESGQSSSATSSSPSEEDQAINEHVWSISYKQTQIIPQGVETDVAEMWTDQTLKPIDINSLVKFVEEENDHIKVDNNNDNDSSNLMKDSDSDNSGYSSAGESIDEENWGIRDFY